MLRISNTQVAVPQQSTISTTHNFLTKSNLSNSFFYQWQNSTFTKNCTQGVLYIKQSCHARDMFSYTYRRQSNWIYSKIHLTKIYKNHQSATGVFSRMNRTLVLGFIFIQDQQIWKGITPGFPGNFSLQYLEL